MRGREPELKARLRLNVDHASIGDSHDDSVGGERGLHEPALPDCEGLCPGAPVEIFRKKLHLRERDVKAGEVIAIKTRIPLHNALAEERRAELVVVGFQPRGIDLRVAGVTGDGRPECPEFFRRDEAPGGALGSRLGKRPHGEELLSGFQRVDFGFEFLYRVDECGDDRAVGD